MKPLAKNNREVLQHINPEKPVKVYRNLHKNCLSVQQGGIVKCHAVNIVLKDAQFLVNDSGRERVRKNKRKEVHAYVKGILANVKETYSHLLFHWNEAFYNPYMVDYFTDTETNRAIKSALYADIHATEPLLTFAAIYK